MLVGGTQLLVNFYSKKSQWGILMGGVESNKGNIHVSKNVLLYIRLGRMAGRIEIKIPFSLNVKHAHLCTNTNYSSVFGY